MTTRFDTSVRDAVLQVRAALGVAMLEDVAVLDIQGTDAAKFLQNRLSNDVLALQPGQGHLNAVLDRQGKIQGIFSLFRTEDSFWVLIDQVEKENAVAQIEKFHIIEQFTIADRSESVHVFSCQGSQVPAFLKSLGDIALPAQELGWLETRIFDMPVRLVNRSLSGEEGVLLVVETTVPDAFLKQLTQAVAGFQGVVMTPAVRDVLRVEAGIPRYGRDYDFETLLPETGLERQAVSYSKGCYLGQETIARVKTYGMVQKALVGLLFEPGTVLPLSGHACLLDGKPVGEIKSVVESSTLQRPIAMAYLGKAERVPGRKLALEIDGQAYPATVTLLPFYDARQQHRSGAALLAEGLKLFSEGFDEEATRMLRQAIEADPNLLDAYEALGVILSRQDKYDEAIGLMEKVLALDPDHVLAHTNLSVFYMKKGDKEKAEDEKAKATMAAFSKKMRESGQVFDLEAERRKKEQATLDRIAMFEEALRFNPEDPLGNFGLGSAYLELKRYTEAIAPFKCTLKAQPKHSVAYLSLGKALEGAQEPDRARETYEKGIEVAAAKGDLMPLREMQTRLDNLNT